MASALVFEQPEGGQSVNSKRITLGTETAKARFGNWSDVGAMPKALPREDVADVNLNHRQSDPHKGIAQGD